MEHKQNRVVTDDLMWSTLPARMRRAATHLLWEIRKDGHTYACALVSRGEYGVEAQVMRDGALMYGWRFNTSGEAVHWATNQELAMTGDEPEVQSNS